MSKILKNTNFKLVVLTSVLCALILLSNWSIKQQYKGWVKVNHTTSGMFIITDNKIYSVSELQTEELKVASMGRR